MNFKRFLLLGLAVATLHGCGGSATTSPSALVTPSLDDQLSQIASDGGISAEDAARLQIEDPALNDQPLHPSIGGAGNFDYGPLSPLIPATTPTPTIPPPPSQPVTGVPFAHLAPFEEHLQQIMLANGIHGTAYAVMKDGRLVYARGFGFADFENGRVVQPDELGRIGSVGKIFECYPALYLSELGKLDLAGNLFAKGGILYDLVPTAQPSYQSHLADYDAMTVLDHMQMVSGWPGALGIITHKIDFLDISEKTMTPPPATSEAVVTYAIGWHDHVGEVPNAPPRKLSQYCDTSYTALAPIIARASGAASYEQYVQEAICQPFGITGMITSPLVYDPAAAAAREEMIYYPLTPAGPSLDPNVKELVPPAYGEDYYSQPQGRWAASPVDLLRFLRGMNNYGLWPGPQALISKSARDLMLANPLDDGKSTYLAMGWEVSHIANGEILYFQKGGDVTGCCAGMWYYPQRHLAFAYIANQDITVAAPGQKLPPITQINKVLRPTLLLIDNNDGWPEGDQFPNYPR